MYISGASENSRSSEREIMVQVGIAEIRDNLADALNKVAYAGERVILSRRGKGIAALVSMEDLELLERLEDETDLDITVKMHVQKSLSINQETNILPKLAKNNPMMEKVYRKLSLEQQIQYLTKISLDRLTSINCDRSYDVGIRLKHFLDQTTYLKRIREIAGFLDIHPDYDKVTEIYKEFHAINQIDRIRYEYRI